MICQVLIFTLVLLAFTHGTFLGKSKIMKCRDVGDNSDPVNGDGSSCQQKLVVTVTVRSGQVLLKLYLINFNY